MYKDVHKFLLFDEIKNGKTVYCLDRKSREVHTVNELTVNDMVAILKGAEEEPQRFEFWEEVDGVL